MFPWEMKAAAIAKSSKFDDYAEKVSLFRTGKQAKFAGDLNFQASYGASLPEAGVSPPMSAGVLHEGGTP